MHIREGKKHTGRWTTIEGLSDRKPQTNKCIFSPGNPNQDHKPLKDVRSRFSKGNSCLKKLIAGSGIFSPLFVFGEAAGGVAGYLMGRGTGHSSPGEEREVPSQWLRSREGNF